MNRSEIFNIMINGESSFAEKKERKVKVPFSSKAVEMLVKYIYGIELEEYQSLDIQSSVSTHNLDIFLELIEIWGIYGIENLDKAVTEKIKQHVNKENVFNIFSFAQLHKADDLKRSAQRKLLESFLRGPSWSRKPSLTFPKWVWNSGGSLRTGRTKVMKIIEQPHQKIIWQVLKLIYCFDYLKPKTYLHRFTCLCKRCSQK